MLIRFAEDKGLDFLIFTSTIVWRILSKVWLKLVEVQLPSILQFFLLQIATGKAQAQKVLSLA